MAKDDPDGRRLEARIPSFEKGDSPEQWVRMFEDTSQYASKWTDELKLKLVTPYLHKKARKWFYNQDFTTWNEFKEEFKSRFEDKRRIKGATNKLRDIQRKKGEHLEDFIDRFDDLKRRHAREVAEYKDMVTSLHDKELCKIFVGAQRSDAMKMIIRTVKRPKTLREAKNYVREIEDAENDDSSEDDYTDTESSSEEPSSSDESETESEDEKSSKRTSRRTRYKASKSGKSHQSSKKASKKKSSSKEKTSTKKRKATKENDTDEAIKGLTEQMGQLTLLISAQQEEAMKTRRNAFACYNCQEQGHQAARCMAPCKICNGKKGDHVFFKCPEYIPRGQRSETSQAKAYLVTSAEDDNMDKESITEQYDESYAAFKRPKEGDSGSDAKKTSPKRIKLKVTEPRQENVTMEDVTTKDVVINQGSSSSRKKTPSNQPTKNAMSLTSPKEKGQVFHELPGDTIKAADMMDAKVFLCSQRQFINSVPGFRTDIKRLATRKQRNPSSGKAKATAYLTQQNEIADVTGNGAPRTDMIVGGSFKTDGILDCGSVGCLISLRMVQALGIDELEETTQKMGMADGRKAPAIGLLRNITVSIMNKSIVTNATVFDQIDYDFLVGRKALHKFGLFTDWSSYKWYMTSDDGTVPVPVSYDGKRRIPSLKQVEEETSGYSAESSEEDWSTDAEEAYLIVPCTDDVADDDEEPEMMLLANQDESSNVQDVQGTTVEEIWQEIEQAVERSDLEIQQKHQLSDLLHDHVDAFGVSYRDLSQTNLLKFHVETGDARPILCQPNRFMSHSELEQLRKEVAEMLEQGQLMPADYQAHKGGGWAFPALYMKKKDGQRRLCVNFQRLNEVTVRDPWPLPSLTDLLEDFGGANLYTTVDLLKGFNQIAVDEESIPKLTMATPWGSFSYRVLPFGVVNGPSTFSRAIYMAMQGFLHDFVSTYIDDITIYSQDWDTHLTHIEAVLKRLKEVCMKLKPSKCMFGQ